MPSHVPSRRRRRATHAFTLVEVALALGIAGFALAGLIGAIPLASDVGRQSITQNRAASIASTIFANFRAKPFSTVPYLDAASGASDSSASSVNLNSVSTGDSKTYYAYFDEVTTTVTAGEARRLHFVAAAPAGTTAFQITLHFNNNPAGTLAPYATASTTTHAQANAVEASIFAVARPKEVYRFSSVVANRSE